MDPILIRIVTTLFVFFFILLSPVLASLYLVVFRGKGVPGRWLFLFVGPILIYTMLWVLWLVFVAPAYVILTFFTPSVQELFNKTPVWYPFASWFAEYDWLLAAIATALLAVWLVRYIWPRWSAIFRALFLPPSEKDNLP